LVVFKLYEKAMKYFRSFPITYMEQPRWLTKLIDAFGLSEDNALADAVVLLSRLPSPRSFVTQSMFTY
jgi:hypothetical protein